jgi:hypothetical protein
MFNDNIITFNLNSESMEIKISLDEYADVPFIKKNYPRQKVLRALRFLKMRKVILGKRLKIRTILQKLWSKVRMIIKMEKPRI